MSGTQPVLLENATRDLAAFASGLRFGDIPSEAVERMKLCALDSIGCCLHGMTLPWTRKVQDMVLAEGGTPAASLFGGGRTSVSQAVLVNSTAGHAFELDDIHKESIIHPGSLALPVAVRQEVQVQHFKVTGQEAIEVPAGRFDAQRVDRTDADRGFSAWYAPAAAGSLIV